MVTLLLKRFYSMLNRESTVVVDREMNVLGKAVTVQEPLSKKVPNDSEYMAEDVDEEEQEDAKDYCKGGYHPVRLGETLNNRYTVLRKLGWGQFSTVWLCWDGTDNKYVAVKIIKSERIYTETAMDEIELLQICSMSDHPFSGKVVKLLNEFTVSGIHGKHKCMVFEVFGHSLLNLIAATNYKGLPLTEVRSIIRQVLQGLHFLHEKCKIIHTDIKPENILTTISVDKVKEMHSEVINATIVGGQYISQRYRSTAPIHVQIRADEYCMKRGEKFKTILDCFQMSTTENSGANKILLTERNASLNEINGISVKIIDLGNACYTYKKFATTIQTRHYRSPEVILGCDYDSSADLWSTACMAFELATGDFLFDPQERRHYSRNESHLALMISMLGDIPHKCVKGRYRRKYFDSKDKLKHINVKKRTSIEQILTGKYNWNESAAKGFAIFLLKILKFDPEERLTAYECLFDPWIENSY